MGKNKTLLKYLDDLGYDLVNTSPFNKLHKIIPAYIEAKSKRMIVDFLIIPGFGIDPANNYQVYVKKK